MLTQTPTNCKTRNVFKSPAPSSKKYLNMQKSPMLTNNFNGVASSNKKGTSQAGGLETWMISPVCSRLREHIQMLNGFSQKERLFLQSPMHTPWPLASPALDTQRTSLYLSSTAPNASTACSNKYLNLGTTSDCFSDIKALPMESPFMIRRFMESEHQLNGEKT